MKIPVLSISGDKKSEVESELFDEKIRQDIIQKVAETEKMRQPYAPSPYAGRMASASGKIRHGRRAWKSAAGKGISRVPRKIFWRRGTQFYWVGATIASARGGRRAHPPRVIGMINTKKINKKERKFALLSALALSASAEDVKKKYKTLHEKEIKLKLPLVVEDKILDLKSKEFLNSLKNILKELQDVAIQKKAIRSGIGKRRGRRYKKSAGILLVTGNDENKKINYIEIKKASELKVSDLASNGARLVMYTEKAIKDLENRLKEDKKEKKSKNAKEKKSK